MKSFLFPKCFFFDKKKSIENFDQKNRSKKEQELFQIAQQLFQILEYVDWSKIVIESAEIVL